MSSPLLPWRLKDNGDGSADIVAVLGDVPVLTGVPLMLAVAIMNAVTNWERLAFKGVPFELALHEVKL